jgi:hypothetical protein
MTEKVAHRVKLRIENQQIENSGSISIKKGYFYGSGG